NRRVLVDFNKTPGFQELGLPDGMTIDVNDKIWMACFEGSAVIQIDPETGEMFAPLWGLYHGQFGKKKCLVDPSVTRNA
ncbi:hypothetical protein MTO96_051249, partial [Rhipicephalus appendiculatus]